jgi:GTPase SAR1 family protein
MSPEEAQAVLDRALELGNLKLRNLIAVITGVMGAGKTCLLKQLFGLKSPEVYTSTGVAEKSCRGLMHHVAKVGSFKVLSQEEIHELLAPVLTSGMAAADIHALSMKNESANCQATSVAADGKPSLSHLQSSVESSFLPLPPSESHASPETMPFQSFTLPQHNAQSLPERSCSSEAVSSVLQKTSKHSNEQDIILELVHAIDTGGQPEYMETMPCLIHNSNLTLLVLNLEQSLDAFPKATLHLDGKEFARTFCFRLTKRQIIERLARTMQAKKCKKAGKDGFKLLVICTHRDRLFFPS